MRKHKGAHFTASLLLSISSPMVALAQNPTQLDDRLTRATRALEDRDYAASDKILGDCTQYSPPTRLKCLVTAAKSASGANDYARALRLIDTIIAANPAPSAVDRDLLLEALVLGKIVADIAGQNSRADEYQRLSDTLATKVFDRECEISATHSGEVAADCRIPFAPQNAQRPDPSDYATTAFDLVTVLYGTDRRLEHAPSAKLEFKTARGK